MAGDWIAIESGTPFKPEIVAIAECLGCSIAEAFLGCFVVWCWFDENSVDGNAGGVTLVTLDALLKMRTGVTGVASAMHKAGWLVVENGKVGMSNWDNHGSQTAKQRKLTAKRVQKFRARKCNAVSVTETLPQNRTVIPPSPPKGGTPRRRRVEPPPQKLSDWRPD